MKTSKNGKKEEKCENMAGWREKRYTVKKKQKTLIQLEEINLIVLEKERKKTKKIPKQIQTR